MSDRTEELLKATQWYVEKADDDGRYYFQAPFNLAFDRERINIYIRDLGNEFEVDDNGDFYSELRNNGFDLPRERMEEIKSFNSNYGNERIQLNLEDYGVYQIEHKRVDINHLHQAIYDTAIFIYTLSLMFAGFGEHEDYD